MSSSWLDGVEPAQFIIGLITAGETFQNIADKVSVQFDVPTTESSIRRFRDRHSGSVDFTVRTDMSKAERPGVQTDQDGSSIVTSEPTQENPLGSPEDMLRERGLDPNDWIIEKSIVNKWGNPDAPFYQLKLWLSPKLAGQMLRMGELKPFDGLRGREPRAVSASTDKPYTVVITGDQQAPFQDPKLHTLFVDWLQYNKPERGVLLGDVVDFPDISRHPDDPENNATVLECLDAGVTTLYDYRDASDQTTWQMLGGNHDLRVRNFVIKHAKQLHGLRPGRRPDEQELESVFALPNLLRLNELGIEYIDPHGAYDQAQITLSKYLAVRHGWLVRPKAGASAGASLEHLGYSVVVGHTHRQGLVHKTTHDIDGTPSTLVGVETGCMCRIDGQVVDGKRFPSYTVTPDWQQGFATATIYPDGKFKIDLATYFNGTLLWRDQRFTV